MIFKCVGKGRRKAKDGKTLTTTMKLHEPLGCKSKMPLMKFKTENLTKTKTTNTTRLLISD